MTAFPRRSVIQLPPWFAPGAYWAFRMALLADAQDCDDLVRIARGWLSECGLGNLAVGDAAMRFYAGSALLGGHDMLCAVVDVEGTLNLHFWEASTGRIYPATQPNLGPFWLATRYDLAVATF